MSANVAIAYSTGMDAVAQAFGDAAAGLAGRAGAGWLNDKVVTVFTDRPEQIAPDSSSRASRRTIPTKRAV
jgi:hypothetical protein